MITAIGKSSRIFQCFSCFVALWIFFILKDTPYINNVLSTSLAYHVIHVLLLLVFDVFTYSLHLPSWSSMLSKGLSCLFSTEGLVKCKLKEESCLCSSFSIICWIFVLIFVCMCLDFVSFLFYSPTSCAKYLTSIVGFAVPFFFGLTYFILHIVMFL